MWLPPLVVVAAAAVYGRAADTVLGKTLLTTPRGPSSFPPPSFAARDVRLG